MSAILNPAPQPSPSIQPGRVEPFAPHYTPPKGGKWKGWLILALIAAGVWAAYEFGYRPAQARKVQQAAVIVPTARTYSGSLERRARITGVTTAREFGNVTAPMIRGPESNRPMVLLKLAPSGANVKRGELIAQIDGQSLQDHIDDVRDTVEAAESDVAKRKAELEIDWKNLEQTLNVAKAELDKARLDEKASEIRTEVERQLLQLNSEEAQARHKQLQADFQATKAQHAADIRILELTLERHRRHMNRHINDYQKFTVRASMDGLVVYQTMWGGAGMRQVEMGDQVGPGQAFMKVVNPGSMMLDAKINQAESEQFRIGQPAVMRLDAFPGMTLRGKVLSIGAIATGGWRQNYYIRSVPIKIGFDSADPRLIPDLSGSADILLEKSGEQILIPKSAVRYENGEPQVAVKNVNGGFDGREVTLGLRNDTHVAVLSGLKADEEVRLHQ